MRQLSFVEIELATDRLARTLGATSPTPGAVATEISGPSATWCSGPRGHASRQGSIEKAVGHTVATIDWDADAGDEVRGFGRKQDYKPDQVGWHSPPC